LDRGGSGNCIGDFRDGINVRFREGWQQDGHRHDILNNPTDRRSIPGKHIP
jgi:hypothetical protein